MKYLAIGLTSVFVIAILIIYLVLSWLPSAAQISNQLRKRPEVTKQQTPPTDPVPPVVATPEEVPIQATEQKSNVVENLVFDRQQPLVNVCEHLTESTRSSVTTNVSQEEFFQSLDEAVRNNPSDPVANSVFAPVRYALRLPKAQRFFDEVRNAELNDDQSITGKASFYAQGLSAYQEMQAHNQQLNDVSNHAYYLFLITEVIRQNPQLAQNPELRGYCETVQNNVLSSAPFDHAKNSQEMLRFLEFAHVKPEAVNFDPNYKSQVKIEFTPTQFSIGFGWVDKYITQPQSTN